MLHRLRNAAILALIALATAGSQSLSAQGAGVPELYRSQLLAAEARSRAILAEAGKPFDSFSRVDYVEFLGSLDLSKVEDLFVWSQTTGIPIVALSEGADFFYANRHVSRPPGAELLRRVGSSRLPDGSFAYHYEGFQPERINYDALSAHLLHPDQIPSRRLIDAGLRLLPLEMVKMLRGKAIYLSRAFGRSYAASTPLSNEWFRYFAGLQTGVFLESRQDSWTAETLIHELCHLVQHTAIDSAYGNLYFPVQYPALAALRPESFRLFGDRYSAAPILDHGYVSAYAMTSGQEDFAEHCSYFVHSRRNFEEQARREASAGKPLLQTKLEFMRKLFEATPFEPVPLSASFFQSKNPEPTATGGCRGVLGAASMACCRGDSRPADPGNVLRACTGKKAWTQLPGRTCSHTADLDGKMWMCR